MKYVRWVLEWVSKESDNFIPTPFQLHSNLELVFFITQTPSNAKDFIEKKFLNELGIIEQFAVGSREDKFFYREKVEGKKVFKFKALPDAKNLDEAELLAADVHQSFR